MPIICIGPVCVPVTAVWAMLVLMLKPIWIRLPESTQKKLLAMFAAVSAFFAPVTNVVAPYYNALAETVVAWLPFGGSTSEQPSVIDVREVVAKARNMIRDEQGGVLKIESLEVYQALLTDCENGRYALVVDFGGEFCEPCQQIKPVFEQASRAFPTMLFTSVDVDNVESVATQCKVLAIPAFHIFKEGKLVGHMEGAKADELTELIKKHAPPVLESKGR
eukprot:g4155.t1